MGLFEGTRVSPLPKTLDDLKTNIEREIKNINKKTLKTVFENFEKKDAIWLYLRKAVILKKNKYFDSGIINSRVFSFF